MSVIRKESQDKEPPNERTLLSKDKVNSQGQSSKGRADRWWGDYPNTDNGAHG